MLAVSGQDDDLENRDSTPHTQREFTLTLHADLCDVLSLLFVSEDRIMRVHDWSRVDDGIFHDFHHAWIEVVSPGNKSSRQRLEAFVRKACALLQQGIHLLVLDLHLPTRRAPNGIHGAIWNNISSSDEDYHQPDDKPLTLVAYQSKLFIGVTAYVEPISIGDLLRKMPIYVNNEGYVSVPLQETYDRAFAAVPQRWAGVLEQ